MKFEERHLGDGVYASFDGDQIWLETKGQHPVNRIALESEVLIALNAYRAYIQLEIEKHPRNPRRG